MEASTVGSTRGLCPPRIIIGPRLLRLRSDEQLVALFRAGHDEAFQVIYDRYHKRLESYARQMLPGGDAEDALQDVFVRAYRALNADDRGLAVCPWLFRIVHNRCIDELRQARPALIEATDAVAPQTHDPVAQSDARESLRRLVEDIQRLPTQQRSALLLRELCGISYADVAAVLDSTVPAVKSLLVRARMGLVRASVARDATCSEIRQELSLAHDQGLRPSPTARRHLRDCPACRSYRGQVRLVQKRLAALLPVGPAAGWAKLISLPGSGATGTGGAAPAAALGTGGAASGTVLGANHLAALIAAAVASAGGTVGLQHAIGAGTRPPAHAVPARHSHRNPSLDPSRPGGAGPIAWRGASPDRAVAGTSSSAPGATLGAGPTDPAPVAGSRPHGPGLSQLTSNASSAGAPIAIPVGGSGVGQPVTTPTPGGTATGPGPGPVTGGPSSGTGSSGTGSADGSGSATGSSSSGPGGSSDGSGSSTPSPSSGSGSPSGSGTDGSGTVGQGSGAGLPASTGQGIAPGDGSGSTDSGQGSSPTAASPGTS